MQLLRHRMDYLTLQHFTSSLHTPLSHLAFPLETFVLTSSFLDSINFGLSARPRRPRHTCGHVGSFTGHSAVCVHFHLHSAASLVSCRLVSSSIISGSTSHLAFGLDYIVFDFTALHHWNLQGISVPRCARLASLVCISVCGLCNSHHLVILM